jgi:RimJ/RimL family protein N-acetyltransferase
MGYSEDVPTLTDGVVTLRAYTLDDLDGCVEMCTDPESAAWTTIPVPYGREDGITWITKAVPHLWVEGTGLEFAVEAPHADGVRRYSGGFSLRPREDGVAGVGFSVHPGARGRGVARRALTLLVDWAFAERGVELVEWHAYVGNWASRRVMWSCGFSFDGTIASYQVQRGERRDVWIGTLRRTDSREPKNAWFDPPILETPRLRLRPFVEADVDRLDEMAQDERSLHFGGRIRGARPDRAAHLLRIREQCASGRMINWCIADRVTDALLGKIQIFDLEGLDDSEVKPGYLVHPDARGRGILTEALKAVVEWTFRPTPQGGFGKRRITISTAASNTASRHAAEQAGFTLACTNPTAFTLGEKGFDDEVLYHLINPNWQPPTIE